MQDELLPEDVLVRRAVAALIDAVGAVDAARFLTLLGTKHQDAVAWHRQWQESLNTEQFLSSVLGSGDEAKQRQPNADRTE